MCLLVSANEPSQRLIAALTQANLSHVVQPQALATAVREPLTPPPATPPYLQQQRPNVYQYCSPFAAASEAAAGAAGPWQQQQQLQHQASQCSEAAGRLQHVLPTLGRRTGPTLGRAPTAAAAAAAEAAALLSAVPDSPTSAAAPMAGSGGKVTAAADAAESAAHPDTGTDAGRIVDRCAASTAGDAATPVSPIEQGGPEGSSGAATLEGGSPPCSTMDAAPCSSQQDMSQPQQVVNGSLRAAPAAEPTPPGLNPFLDLSYHGWDE